MEELVASVQPFIFSTKPFLRHFFANIHTIKSDIILMLNLYKYSLKDSDIYKKYYFYRRRMETNDQIFMKMLDSMQNPYPLYRELRDNMPIIYSQNMESYFVSRYDTCHSILSSSKFGHLQNDKEPVAPIHDKYMQDYSGKHPKMKQKSILSLNPPDHTRIRNLVSKAFTPRSIELLKPFISELSDRLLNTGGRREIDLITEFAAPLPAYVIAKLMGVPDKDMPKFKELSDEFAKLLNPFSSDDEIYGGYVAKGELGKYFNELIALRKKDPTDDMLSRIVHDIENGYSITEEELLTMLSLLLVAGHETTTNLIGNGFYALLRNRDQMEMLQNDRSLLKNAIEEMLRYDSPVQMVVRTPMAEDAIIEGETVKKDQFVACVIGSANHDESVFRDPEKFDITRKEIKHLSFSEGIHFCLGAPLARVEGAIAFDKLLDSFGDCRLLETPKYRSNFNMRGLEHLRMSF